MRTASSAAALFVNVRPSTSSGRTAPVPTSHTTRAAITVVLPDPAPAMTTPGSSGAVIAATCWSVNGTPNSSRRSAAVMAAAGSGPSRKEQLGHRITCRPSSRAGHEVLNWQ